MTPKNLDRRLSTLQRQDRLESGHVKDSNGAVITNRLELCRSFEKCVAGITWCALRFWITYHEKVKFDIHIELGDANQGFLELSIEFLKIGHIALGNNASVCNKPIIGPNQEVLVVTLPYFKTITGEFRNLEHLGEIDDLTNSDAKIGPRCTVHRQLGFVCSLKADATPADDDVFLFQGYNLSIG